MAWGRGELFALEPGDQVPLKRLGPTFALIAAQAVVIAATVKPLFLTANPLQLLPWMFLGCAAFTAVSSIIYVATMRHHGLRRRFPFLLGAAIVSFILLRLAFPINRQLISMVAYIWAPGIGNLVIMQAWNMGSTLLPTRQAKRLFPVLAGIATAGAAIGGGMAQVLTRWLPAENLLWLAVLLLAVPFVRVRKVIDALEAGMPDDTQENRVPRFKDGQASKDEEREPNEVVRGFQNLIEHPLLSRLAVLVFLIQAASVLVDYQFSGELKANFAKDEMASFLGSFYWVSNLTGFVLTLFATGRLVKVLGIGLVLAAGGFFMAAGSGLYIAAAMSPFLSAFWTMAFVAFADRVGQYAMTKPATQMLVTPLDARKGERAKTLIDGVVYRLATAIASVLLLILSPEMGELHALSPGVVVACVVVVFLGVRIAPHYRKALLDALSSRRLDASLARYLKVSMGSQAVDDVERRLQSNESTEILQALDVAKEMSLKVSTERLFGLLDHSDPEVAAATIETIETLKIQPPDEVVQSLLHPQRPPAVLRATLHLLTEQPRPQLRNLIRPLSKHADASVASLASVLRMRTGQTMDMHALNDDIGQDIASQDAGRRARGVRMAAETQSLSFAAELPRMLVDSSLRVRLEAVDAMGQVTLPQFIVPLVGCLRQGELRAAAAEALLRYGTRLIPLVRDQIAASELPLVATMTLVRVIERLGGDAALHVLTEIADDPRPGMRSAALASMWRMTRDPKLAKPDLGWLKERAVRDIKKLEDYTAVEAHTAGASLRRLFFLGELEARRVEAEVRVFRLLGLIYSRAAMHRAYLHYHSPNPRTRSNAIELLDQHVDDPRLRPFVALVERVEGDEGTLRTRTSIDMEPPPSAEVEGMLGEDEPWLKRVWSWVVSTRGGDTFQLDWDDPIERVLLLKGIPLFRTLTGEDLLPVGQLLERVELEAGQVVFEHGEPGDRLYLVERGEVEVVLVGRVLASLGAKECFGEIALLDGSPRSATVRTSKRSSLMIISREGFRDLLDLHPALARGIIKVLSSRLRATTKDR